MPLPPAARRPGAFIGFSIALVFCAAMIDAFLWQHGVERESLQLQVTEVEMQAAELAMENEELRTENERLRNSLEAHAVYAEVRKSTIKLVRESDGVVLHEIEVPDDLKLELKRVRAPADGP